MNVVVIVSGGMDSVTLANMLYSRGHDLHLLAFDYGQRHVKELRFAELCAKHLDAKFDCIDLSSVKGLLKGSALTDDGINIPEGHYADASMAATVVPNRNAMMLSIAYAAAVAEKSDMVAIGVHAGDHPIYPDCRPVFIKAFDSMQRVAVEGYGKKLLQLYAPFVSIGKHDIVKLGNELGVPYDETWSCYKGGELHCGKCGTCVERIEAFELAGVKDVTRYEDMATTHN